jgi:membrane-bound acyltransferase YfiQ involved in biofilm formation
MTIFYINQNLIGSKLVRALSFICAMNFFVFISEGAGGWLWFLGNLDMKYIEINIHCGT